LRFICESYSDKIEALNPINGRKYLKITIFWQKMERALYFEALSGLK